MATLRAGVLVLLATALAVPAQAQSRFKRVLIITDPDDSTRATQLLEGALIDHISSSGEYSVVAPRKPTSKEARAHKLFDQAMRLRSKGREAFETLELDQALRDYGKALQKLDRSVALHTTVAPLVDTLAMLAATQLLIGQERKARGLLQRALVLDPTLIPDEAVYNPQMMEVLEAVRAAVDSQPGAGVDIETDPSGAAVHFDGQFVGLSPARVRNVYRGRHYLRVSKPGFDIATRVVEVRGSDAGVVTLSLDDLSSDRAARMMSTAVDKIEDADLPREARSLASQAKADQVLVVAMLEDDYLLVKYAASGGDRSEHTANAEIDSAFEARDSAQQIAPWVPPSRRKKVSASSAGAWGDSEVAPADPEDDDLVVATTEPSRRPRRPKPEAEPDDDGWNTGETESISAVDASQADQTDPYEDISEGGGPFTASAAKDYTMIGTASLTVVFAVLGGVFGGLALVDQNTYALEDAPGGRINHDATTDQLEGQEIADSGQTKALMADIFWGLTGLAAVITLAVALFWDTEPEVDTGTVAYPDGPPPDSEGGEDAPPDDGAGGDDWSTGGDEPADDSSDDWAKPPEGESSGGGWDFLFTPHGVGIRF